MHNLHVSRSSKAGSGRANENNYASERADPGTHLEIDAEDDDIEVRLGMAKSLRSAVFFSLDSNPNICVL
jgi:hypothetical protein